MNYQSWDELDADVTQRRLIAVELQVLKDLQGVRRLGANVLAAIADQLAALGIEFFPEWILNSNGEPRQNQTVWLVPADAADPVYRVVAAVQRPDTEGVEALRALLESDSGWDEVEQLKERLANVRAALDDALEFIGDDDAAGGRSARPTSSRTRAR